MSLKSVLITGCSKGGIGSELAYAFQKAGLLVFATARTPSKIDPELLKLPNVESLDLDVSSSKSIAAAAKAVDSRLNGRLDILVNNAGFGVNGPIIDADIAEAKAMFDVNIFSVIEVTQAFMPFLVKSKGTVLNISSVGGWAFMPFNGLYGASKAALTAIGETLRLEMSPYQVKVVTMATGRIKTEFFANSPAFELRSDSMWKKIENNARESIQGGSDWMPAKQYAEKVVRDVLGGANGIVWRGAAASTVRFLVSWLPTFVVDRVLTSGLGLETLP